MGLFSTCLDRLNLVMNQGVLGRMAQVIVSENEGIESALRRLSVRYRGPISFQT